MMTMISDTTAEAEQILLKLLRRAPIWRKLEIMGQLNGMAKSLALNNLRRQYPEATENELRRRLADRLLGPELAATVYGPPAVSITGREEGDAV
jgi:hypothetical protein